jgi:hypothetical protein
MIKTINRDYSGASLMMTHTSEIRICMDIGNKRHHVAIGLSTGELLEHFDLCHTSTDIQAFFIRLINTRGTIIFLWQWLWKVIMATRDTLIKLS